MDFLYMVLPFLPRPSVGRIVRKFDKVQRKLVKHGEASKRRHARAQNAANYHSVQADRAAHISQQIGKLLGA